MPPRLPLEGSLDLTYRCNNACRHCWLWLPRNAPEEQQELSFDEIRRIAGEARAMGCRKWKISGGEPMLRPDFHDIFDYLTSRSASYTLNTNGTLITPSVAQLLKRKGAKMVALYGATAEVYDHVARHPGGFDQAMQGFRYLKEAGAPFIVQLIPMRDNWHQWQQMLDLAKNLSPVWRVGAPWLSLSACGSPKRNAEINAQRLDPADVAALDPPGVAYEERMAEIQAEEEPAAACGCASPDDDRLFASCIAQRRDFHIDPYGGMTFCSYLKGSAMRYSLRGGSFREAWDEFIPSLADKVRGGPEYLKNCGSCGRRRNCRWCAVYGYLEQGRFAARVPHLCAVADETERLRRDWLRDHRRYFQIAGITIQVESVLPFAGTTFDAKLGLFAASGPGDDTVTIRQHFELPELNGRDLGEEVHRIRNWIVSRKRDTWIYRLHNRDGRGEPFLSQVAVFNDDHSHGEVYSRDAMAFHRGGMGSLSSLPTDQLLLAPLLADRHGCYLHSSGVILGGQGLLFAGHSGAGKSTMIKMIRDRADILCDDRMIVRRWPEGFRIHGNWSHGEVPQVSSASAPLDAVLFLSQRPVNRLARLRDRRTITGKLLACLVQPVVTPDWFRKTLPLIDSIAREVPCYEMEFDKSGAIVDLLKELAGGR